MDHIWVTYGHVGHRFVKHGANIGQIDHILVNHGPFLGHMAHIWVSHGHIEVIWVIDESNGTDIDQPWDSGRY